MKYIELQRSFETKLGILDESSNLKMQSSDIEYWLNLGLEKFVLDRIQNYFQLNQIITDDLSTIVVSDTIAQNDGRWSISSDGLGVSIEYKLTADSKPSDYWIMMGENAKIIGHVASAGKDQEWPLDENGAAIPKIVDVIECTVENITSRLNNSLSEHRLHNGTAKPLRLFSGNVVTLYTDSNYDVTAYNMVYIKRPTSIALSTSNAFLEYDGMPKHTHEEIVDNSITLYLDSVIKKKKFLGPEENK